MAQMAVVVTESSMPPHRSGDLGLPKFYPRLSAKAPPVNTTYVRVEFHQPRPPRLPPALRLPSELLQEIFSIYARLCPRRRGYVEGLRWDSWIQVTHVCRRWRSVAVAFPALWTRVTVTNHRVARAMFHRSGELPLDVVCYVTAHEHPGSGSHDHITRAYERLEVTMEELYRIRRLEIVSTSWSRTFVSSLTWLGQPAPQLECLALDIAASSGVGAKRPELPVSTFTLFQASNLTRLHTLHLSDEMHRWCTPLPSSLRVLEVSHAHLLVQDGSTWKFNVELLTALSAVPKLEQLVIADSPNVSALAHHPVIQDSLPRVVLPHLRTVTVVDSLPLPSLCLLDHLTLPSTTQIRLEMLPDDDLDVPAITALLARQLCRGTCSPDHAHAPYQIRSLLLRCSETTIDLIGWTDALPTSSLECSCSPDATTPPKLTLRFALDPADADARRLQWSVLAEDVLEDLVLPDTTALRIEPVRPFTLLTDFRRTLAGFGALTTLAVAGWTTRQLLALLHAARPFSNDVFLPCLRTLVLVRAHFPPVLEDERKIVSRAGAAVGMQRSRAGRAQLALLVDRLALRRARGYTLGSLVLRRCYNVYACDVASLRAVVGLLDWDGTSCVGGADVWAGEEVPYGMRYSWEPSDEP